MPCRRSAKEAESCPVSGSVVLTVVGAAAEGGDEVQKGGTGRGCKEREQQQTQLLK